MVISYGTNIKMSVGRNSRYTRDTKLIFDWVESITGNAKTAIEASSWCELATVGEVFIHDFFSLEISLDDKDE